MTGKAIPTSSSSPVQAVSSALIRENKTILWKWGQSFLPVTFSDYHHQSWIGRPATTLLVKSMDGSGGCCSRCCCCLYFCTFLNNSIVWWLLGRWRWGDDDENRRYWLLMMMMCIITRPCGWSITATGGCAYCRWPITIVVAISIRYSVNDSCDQNTM